MHMYGCNYVDCSGAIDFLHALCVSLFPKEDRVEEVGEGEKVCSILWERNDAFCSCDFMGIANSDKQESVTWLFMSGGEKTMIFSCCVSVWNTHEF